MHQSSDDECYDFVIVGAGPSAMGLLYGLLEPFRDREREPSFSLCLVDQGGYMHETATRDPKDWYGASHTKSSKSAYQIPSVITNRVVDLPIGKGLGGTSNINAALCTPPLASDLKSWPSPWESNLLTYVHEIQSVLRDNGALKEGGTSSCFPFKEKSSLNMMQGVPCLAAKNGDSGIHFEYMRRNYFDGLLKPLLENNPQLKNSVDFRLYSQVQRILVNDTKSTVKGLVYLSRNGELHTVYARKEVILCAGAIESPVLLQLSGLSVGGQVGLHLKDQVLLPRVFFTTVSESQRPTTVNGIQALGHWGDGRDLSQVAILETRTIRTIVPSTVAMAVRRYCTGFPFPQIRSRIFEFAYLFLKGLLSWTLWFSPVRRFLESYIVATLLFLMHPISEGSVRIQSTNSGKPTEELMRRDVDIIVDFNYLKNEKDIETLRHSWDSIPRDRHAYEIFPRYIFLPLSLIGFGWDWFPAFCRLFSQPYYHYSSSCKMRTENASDSDWVVHWNLSVRGHSNLRICDASVFPDTISSPPALTCASLGYGLGKHLIAVMEGGNSFP